jgi:TonB family protein
VIVRADSQASPPPTLQGRDGIAYRDDLTGLYNRRLLNELLGETWAVLLASHGTAAVIALDLDLFKEVNDTWGHLAGDEALRTAAEQLRRHLRDTDFLVRYGGDEFIAVLPGVDEAEAGALVERARLALQGNRFQPSLDSPPVDLPISFSHGVALAPRDGATGEEVLRKADERLYEDKRQRRQLQDAAGARRFTPWWPLALVVAAVLAVVGLAWWVLRPTPVAESAPAAVQVETLANPPAMPAAVNVDGLLRQIAELEAQVGTLNQALQAERSQDNRDQYERQLRDLGGTIADLQAQLVVASPGTPLAGPAAAAKADAGESAAATGVVAAQPQAPAVGTRSPEPTVVAAIRAPLLATPLRLSYPYAARQMRREATIELLVTVEPDGAVSAAEPIGPRIGLGFEEAAQQAVRRARFQPGTRDGVAARMPTKLSVRFELDSP